jgi:hypothetical protein
MLKIRRRSSFGKEKNRKSLSPFWFVFLFVCSVVVAEMLVRGFIGIKGQTKEFGAYQGEPPEITSYRLKFLSHNQKPIDGLSDRGNLATQESLGVGYKLLSNQSNENWTINEQGFRDQENIPLAKPQGEIRIFLIGGSTAFGQWSNSNQDTISHNLQNLLQQRVSQQKQNPDQYYPDEFPFYLPSRETALQKKPKIREGKYRVINAAVPGYTSGNQLALVILEILAYKPDLIIVLDGYGDLILPSGEFGASIPKRDEFMTDASKHFATSASHSIQQLFKDTYLVKASQLFFLNPQPTIAQKTIVLDPDGKSLGSYLPPNEEELNLRVQRWQKNHKQLIRLSAGSQIPVVMAIQPEITGRSQPSAPDNQIISALGNDYIEKVKQDYPKFVEGGKQLEKAFPNNVKFLNFYNLNDKFPENTFVDAIHLTPEANKEMAEQMYYAIIGLKKMQIIPKNFDL